MVLARNARGMAASTDRRPWTADRGLQTVDRRPWTADRGPWIADRRGGPGGWGGKSAHSKERVRELLAKL